jgi:3-oxoadipate enol-lactonase
MKLITSCCLVAFLLLMGCNSTPETKEPQTGYIKLDSATIYYESYGEGEPLLLLHAGFLNTDMWKAQMPEFSKHYRVIALDLPGHGRTENDTFRWRPASDINAILDTLKIQKTSVIGVSLGAACATDFIIAHPERVNKAVLVASGIYGWDKKFKVDTMATQYITNLFAELEHGDTAAAAEIFTRVWFDGPFRSPKEVNDTARRYIYETTLSNMKKHKVRGWPILNEPPAIERLSGIKLPLFIIDGDKDMPYIGKACSYIQQQVAGSKRITIPGTGHMVNMEAPEAFNKAVLDFLKN